LSISTGFLEEEDVVLTCASGLRAKALRTSVARVVATTAGRTISLYREWPSG
jgi:hypothetical protein